LALLKEFHEAISEAVCLQAQLTLRGAVRIVNQHDGIANLSLMLVLDLYGGAVDERIERCGLVPPDGDVVLIESAKCFHHVQLIR
jgi:hypothetical protein